MHNQVKDELTEQINIVKNEMKLGIRVCTIINFIL